MFRICVGTVAAVIVSMLVNPISMAQNTDAAASSLKQTQKAERKAARKAARANKNADLKKLEQNGYKPGSDRTDYPQDIQDAEKKTAAGKEAAGR